MSSRSTEAVFPANPMRNQSNENWKAPFNAPMKKGLNGAKPAENSSKPNIRGRRSPKRSSMPANTIADKEPVAKTQRVRLDLFDSTVGLDRGRGPFIEAFWYLTKCLFFLSPLPWPQHLKIFLLRIFGGKVGSGVVIKPRVNIHFPWKLSIGDHCWIGEEALILNFEPVTIGNHVCLSQRVFLCTGNHDFRDRAFSYRNAPISIGSGAWIGAQSFIGPGTEIGTESVVTAGSVVSKNLPNGMICRGNPAVALKPRWETPS